MSSGHMETLSPSARLPLELKPEGGVPLVRIGSVHDGGYILPAALLERIDHVLSFGLGFNFDFERDMLRLTAVKRIDCYDHSVSAAGMRRHRLVSLLKYFYKTPKRRIRLAAARAYLALFSDNPRIRHLVMKVGAQDSTTETSLRAALERLGAASDAIFLKCDIEGGEYEIIDEIVASAGRFCGMAIEFHEVDQRLETILSFLRRLRPTHRIDHVHVNNAMTFETGELPKLLEISLSRRDVPPAGDLTRLDRAGLRHAMDGRALDAPNAPERADVGIAYA